MNKKAKIALFCTAVLLISAVLFGSVYAVSRAAGEKDKYIESEKSLALSDLNDALNEMELALSESDGDALNRAAGRAEAYLSRAGIGDCGRIYAEIEKICSGEYEAEECLWLINAIKSAAKGNTAFFREIGGAEIPVESEKEETAEDPLSSHMMKKLGTSADKTAFRRAAAFACPNAEFEECNTEIEYSYAYSGDNIFILISGKTPRVIMYCFDREIDSRYSVTKEEAERSVEIIIKKEKLRLGEKRITEENGGVYRTVCYGKNDLSDTPLVIFEIYSDTGRLRLYDAVNYYNNPS